MTAMARMSQNMSAAVNIGLRREEVAELVPRLVIYVPEPISAQQIERSMLNIQS